jgi:hypothetical protein
VEEAGVNDGKTFNKDGDKAGSCKSSRLGDCSLVNRYVLMAFKRAWGKMFSRKSIQKALLTPISLKRRVTMRDIGVGNATKA